DVPPGRDFDFDALVPVPHRVVHAARESLGVASLGNAECDATRDGRRRLHAQRLAEEHGKTCPTGVRYQVPRGRLDPRAGEPVAANPAAQRVVYGLGPLELPAY